MGTYDNFGSINQTEYTSYPRKPLRSPLLKPNLRGTKISKLGSIAMKADEFLMKEISTELFMQGVKEVFGPRPEATLYKSNDITDLIIRSNELLASAKTVWPFTLFRDDIIVDRTKLTITKRSFFFVSEVMSIRLEDILNVKVSLGPFFGSLTFAVRVLSSEDHHTVNFFWRSDAIHIKHIVQGYIIAHHNDIQCKDQNREELIATLSELGHDNN